MKSFKEYSTPVKIAGCLYWAGFLSLMVGTFMLTFYRDTTFYLWAVTIAILFFPVLCLSIGTIVAVLPSLRKDYEKEKGKAGSTQESGHS